MMGVVDYHQATWSQNFVASIAGAVASITVAAPLDTVKTRIQNANFEQKVSGVTVIRDMLRTEGAGALFKGLTPKVHILVGAWYHSSAEQSTDRGRRTEIGLWIHDGPVAHPLVRQLCLKEPPTLVLRQKDGLTTTFHFRIDARFYVQLFALPCIIANSHRSLVLDLLQ